MDVLSAVQKTISEHGAGHVTLVGHSLGMSWSEKVDFLS